MASIDNVMKYNVQSENNGLDGYVIPANQIPIQDKIRVKSQNPPISVETKQFPTSLNDLIIGKTQNNKKFSIGGTKAEAVLDTYNRKAELNTAESALSRSRDAEQAAITKALEDERNQMMQGTLGGYYAMSVPQYQYRYPYMYPYLSPYVYQYPLFPSQPPASIQGQTVKTPVNPKKKPVDYKKGCDGMGNSGISIYKCKQGNVVSYVMDIVDSKNRNKTKN